VRRIIIRLLVTLFTFIIGITTTVSINSLSALFAKRAERPVVSLSVKPPSAPSKPENKAFSISCGCNKDADDFDTAVRASDAHGAYISGGVLNGKAISLPKPLYPPIAKTAHVSGTVTVEILVDERGCVISARAVSGHPLLQWAAVQAARQACFSPTTLGGQFVKLKGVIIYNFMLP
jgi:TonB family protein